MSQNKIVFLKPPVKLTISDVVEMLINTQLCPECGLNESLYSVLDIEKFLFNPAVSFLCSGKYDPLGRRDPYRWEVFMKDLKADAKELLEMEV